MGGAEHYFGSSPLARGLLPLGDDPATVLGIIPARAGFTRRTPQDSVRPQDHPRSRGVYRNITAEVQETGGSSPLARGLHRMTRRQVEAHRIIPARAGFTSTASARRPSNQDHPRSRGVYSPCAPWSQISSGSSPLARGLRRHLLDPPGREGIIPARAGFTPSSTDTPIPARDHPRSRGVYWHYIRQRRRRWGSSPLARGLPPQPPPPPHGGRIIPARAGFTRRGDQVHPSRWDHPRSRGVYRVSFLLFPSSCGSSPLARGLRVRPRPLGRRAPDHPRSRGVYSPSAPP